MKKLAFLIAISFLGSVAVQAINPVNPSANAADQVIYAKVINDTGTAFKYKVGNDEFIIDVNESEPFAFDENTQILKKNSEGNWVNWFVFNSSHAGQSIQLSTLLN